ncbi:uncharacterized protein LOC117641091 [Thrips palmi]|uniref:Uncharacterized protein LOC117641091 n=1 Tax=Thrips palmi TaxID=161013 RepID=A0A6P8Y3K5_THRPL|nr:uncharacterized protein LOC117641091 [Thrips palmi]
MAGISTPGHVDLQNGNIQATWEAYKQKLDFYITSLEKAGADPTVKHAILMREAGPDVMDIYNSFKSKMITYKVNEETQEREVDVDNSKNYDLVLKEFDKYVAEKKCVTTSREIFNARNQKRGESITTWVTSLRNLIADCEYKEVEESMLKDRIIWGVFDDKLRVNIRAKASLKLDEIIEICKAVEATSRYSNQTEQKVAEVDTAQASGSGYRQKTHHYNQSRNASSSSGKNSRGNWGPQRQAPYQKPSHSRSEQKYKCRNCGTWHCKRECPAYGAQCKICGRKNHFTKVCETKNTHSSNSRDQKVKKSVDAVETLDLGSEEEEDLLRGGWNSSASQSSPAKSQATDDEGSSPRRQRYSGRERGMGDL